MKRWQFSGETFASCYSIEMFTVRIPISAMPLANAKGKRDETWMLKTIHNPRKTCEVLNMLWARVAPWSRVAETQQNDFLE